MQLSRASPPPTSPTQRLLSSEVRTVSGLSSVQENEVRGMKAQSSPLRRVGEALACGRCDNAEAPVWGSIFGVKRDYAA